MAEISVIIPVYNVKNFLPKCVDSVFNQTYKNIEIILVDDGSIDGSGALCDGYAKKDKRVTVIHKENGGLSSARNAGTAVSKGDFILFLDGDDCLRKEAVEILLNVQSKCGSDIVQFEYEEVDNFTDEGDYTFSDSVETSSDSHDFFVRLYKKGGVYASACTKLIKSQLAKSILFEDMTSEDENWCTSVFTLPIELCYIPDKLYYYINRSGSIIHSAYSERKLDVFKCIENRIKCLKENKFDDLLFLEYNKLFGSIVGLYDEAICARSKSGKRYIKNIFLSERENLKKNCRLSVKYNLLLKFMLLNFNFIKIYDFYWFIKRKITGE